LIKFRYESFIEGLKNGCGENVQLMTSTEVAEIEWGPNGVLATLTDGGGRVQTVEAAVAVVTVSLGERQA